MSPSTVASRRPSGGQPGSWRATASALPEVLDRLGTLGLPVVAA